MRGLMIAAVAMMAMAWVHPAQAHPDSGWMPDQPAAHSVRPSRHVVKHRRHFNRIVKAIPRARPSNHAAKSDMAPRIVAHPAGCPASAFCGCGVAVHVFGRPVRSLWLAASWYRFPAALPAPGMVAVRSGHVFAILRLVGAGMVLAYDPNSGGHQTRVHVRSLVGFSVRNPRSRMAHTGGAG